MNCHQFEEIVESYISDELLVETNHEVLRHLENCAACREELAVRRSFRRKLRAAVKTAPDAQIDPAFARRLQADLRQTALHRSKWHEILENLNFFSRKQFLVTTAVLCVLMVAGIGAFWLNYPNGSQQDISIAKNQTNGSFPANTSDNNLELDASPIAEVVQVAWREITDSAVGDHKNCALKFNLAEKPISLQEAAKKYGQFNRDLDQTIIKPLREVFPANGGDEIKLLQAHSCVFGRRRFAHIVLRRQNRTISILVTQANDLLNNIGSEILSRTMDDLQIASFSTKSYAVFVVSNLPDAENTSVARIIMNPVREHLGRFAA